jgi:hypothetical protein
MDVLVRPRIVLRISVAIGDRQLRATSVTLDGARRTRALAQAGRARPGSCPRHYDEDDEFTAA